MKNEMQDALAYRVQVLLGREPARSIFRCPECGSFVDPMHSKAHLGRRARRCATCDGATASSHRPRVPAGPGITDRF